MKITFLGTRGYIDAHTRRHKHHTVTMLEYAGTKIMVDCGRDWIGKFQNYDPDLILLTHAHPDHAEGLKCGAPSPVWATQESFEVIKKYPLEQKKVIQSGKKYKFGPFSIEPFFVEHSLRCPAVGYRIAAGGSLIFIAHDIISIPERRKALRGVEAYIGDGASITRPIIRRRGKLLFGHTTIRAQIGWCKKEEVPHAIFTHCGSQIVEGDERVLGAQVRRIGREAGVQARIAYDGLKINLKKEGR